MNVDYTIASYNFYSYESDINWMIEDQTVLTELSANILYDSICRNFTNIMLIVDFYRGKVPRIGYLVWR